MNDLFETGNARFDPSKTYRYYLNRVWDAGKPRCVFIMLNPSTADAEVFDPTVRRCYNFAKNWGAGTLEVLNLFALRSTDPEELYRERKRGIDIIGIMNDGEIHATLVGGNLGFVIAGWGKHGLLLNRGDHVAKAVREILRPTGLQLLCLGVNKDGTPKHPLYLRADQEPFPYWNQEKQSDVRHDEGTETEVDVSGEGTGQGTEASGAASAVECNGDGLDRGRGEEAELL